MWRRHAWAARAGAAHVQAAPSTVAATRLPGPVNKPPRSSAVHAAGCTVSFWSLLQDEPYKPGSPTLILKTTLLLLIVLPPKVAERYRSVSNAECSVRCSVVGERRSGATICRIRLCAGVCCDNFYVTTTDAAIAAATKVDKSELLQPAVKGDCRVGSRGS
jgi:hypothetical protein